MSTAETPAPGAVSTHPGGPALATPPGTPAPRRGRRRWVVGVLAALLAVGGAAAVLAARAPLAPEVRLTGVPDVVTAGSVLDVEVHVSFPARWPSEVVDGGRDDRAVYGLTGRTVVAGDETEAAPVGTEVEAILCSGGITRAAGQETVLGCRVTAPSAGPWTLTVQVTAPGDDGWDTRTSFTYDVD